MRYLKSMFVVTYDWPLGRIDGNAACLALVEVIREGVALVLDRCDGLMHVGVRRERMATVALLESWCEWRACRSAAR